jgi:hypothetical protein
VPEERQMHLLIGVMFSPDVILWSWGSPKTVRQTASHYYHPSSVTIEAFSRVGGKEETLSKRKLGKDSRI